MQVNPKSLSMTDSSSWKLIRLRSFIPIRSHARRNSAVVINLERHGRFVTDKCFMRLTERNRRNYGFYIKPVRDFRKLRRRHIRVRFRPIRKTPGFCGFWKGYRLPSIQVNLHFWFLIETVAVSASGKVRQWTRVNNEKPECVFERRSELYRVFSHDVTAAILVSQNNETAAMLVSQTSPVGVELLSYANAFFCSKKFA